MLICSNVISNEMYTIIYIEDLIYTFSNALMWSTVLSYELIIKLDKYIWLKR